MKLFSKMHDGGPDSPVIGWFLIEWKALFSIVLLKFPDTREAYHSHAFNALTIWLKGKVTEYYLDGVQWSSRPWRAGQIKITKRDTVHKVVPFETAWALSFRGPWCDWWVEYVPKEKKWIELTHGRQIVGELKLREGESECARYLQ